MLIFLRPKLTNQYKIYKLNANSSSSSLNGFQLNANLTLLLDSNDL